MKIAYKIIIVNVPLKGFEWYDCFINFGSMDSRLSVIPSFARDLVAEWHEKISCHSTRERDSSQCSE